MKKEELKKLIDTAAGRIPADTVIKNCQVVNVFPERSRRAISLFAEIKSQESESIRV